MSLVSVLLAYTHVIFPEKKASGYYLYNVIDTDDADIVSVDVYVAGQELFFVLDTFIQGSKVFSGAFIPTEEIKDFSRYELSVRIQTPQGQRVIREGLLGINGMLLPL